MLPGPLGLTVGEGLSNRLYAHLAQTDRATAKGAGPDLLHPLPHPPSGSASSSPTVRQAQEPEASARQREGSDFSFIVRSPRRRERGFYEVLHAWHRVSISKNTSNGGRDASHPAGRLRSLRLAREEK